jgi:hypothetical protein
VRVSDLHRRILAGRIPINLLSNLVAYWNFDGNGIDSVNGITPSLETNVTYNNASILGTSSSIGANTSSILRYADRNDFSFVNGSNTGDVPFSISCWVFFTGFSSVGNWLINKRDVGSNNEYQLTFFESRLNLVKFNNGFPNENQRVQSSINPFLLNTWYHLVATDKGTGNFNDMNLYINGLNNSVLRFTTGAYTKMSNLSSPLCMLNAGFNPNNTNHHQGRLDEVAIWKNRELTPAEVAYLYNSGLGRTYPL